MYGLSMVGSVFIVSGKSYRKCATSITVFCEICFSFRAWKAQPGRFAYKALYAADLWSLRIEGL